jgi:exodeoxyribonuclease VII small subunit
MDENKEKDITSALESTLDDLTRSIERMETIIAELESGGVDWEDSVRLISEANELAMSSSQKLDRAVQDVVYGSGDRAAEGDEEEEDRQESLDLP